MPTVQLQVLSQRHFQTLSSLEMIYHSPSFHLAKLYRFMDQKDLEKLFLSRHTLKCHPRVPPPRALTLFPTSRMGGIVKASWDLRGNQPSPTPKLFFCWGIWPLRSHPWTYRIGVGVGVVSENSRKVSTSTRGGSTCPLSTLITFITHHFEGGVFLNLKTN